jgi:low temperature requirement protein LtrA
MNEIARAVGEGFKESILGGYAHYWWVAVISFFAATVRVIREHKLGDKTWKQILAIFVGEIVISLFVGFNTFLACKSAGLSEIATALMISTGAYMGGKALGLFEAMYKAWLKKIP